jgi:hypothetical protein
MFLCNLPYRLAQTLAQKKISVNTRFGNTWFFTKTIIIFYQLLPTEPHFIPQNTTQRAERATDAPQKPLSNEIVALQTKKWYDDKKLQKGVVAVDL